MAAWHYIKGRWWIFAIPLVVSTVVGTGLIVLHFAATSAPPLPWHKSFLTMGIFLIISPVVGIMWTLGIMARGQRREQELLERGVPGSAILESVNETGLYTNDVPQLEMVLLVSIGDAAPVRVTHREHVSLIHLPKLIPGAKLRVVVDPDAPEKLLLDL